VTLETKYADVYTALVNVVKTVISDTFRGEKVKIEKYPLAFVIPRSDVITDRSIKTTEHSAAFDIVILDRHEDTEIGLTNVITYGSRVFDKLNADRTLGGKVETLTFEEFSPDFESGPTFAIHWLLLRVVCKFSV
jgi:hypothetical protein